MLILPMQLLVPPFLLALIPVTSITLAWRYQSGQASLLPNTRRALFRLGIAASILSLLVTMSCWVDPYPLRQTLDGGYSIAWLDDAWMVAFATSLLGVALALFGKGRPRALLILSNIASLLLAFGSLLQNGV
ncbi:hypothetical protein HDF08_002197 [Edaphobacter lichenicola]|uniref:Uncharacterized protein n=1 Tax=Tunturiibacter lichenicola TaxID=2051959 RepID=A0A852VEP4_9BACT|nr:hypothetical protein [Edaphobacter lichenicola]